jgi:hypothetical protein
VGLRRPLECRWWFIRVDADGDLATQVSDGLTIGVLVGMQAIMGSADPAKLKPVVKIRTVSDFTSSARPLQLEVGVKVSGRNDHEFNVADASTFDALDVSVGLRKRLRDKHRFSVALECGAEGSLGVEGSKPARYCGGGVVFDTTTRGRLAVMVQPVDERLGRRGVTAQAYGALDLAPATGTIGAWLFGRGIVGRGGKVRLEIGVGVSR